MLSVSDPAALSKSSHPPGKAEAEHSNPSLLALWHLGSLDAPSVATVWTWFAARCFGASLNAWELTGMFLAVWMLYAADRLLDARTSRRGSRLLEPRHQFHAVHRRIFLALLAAAAIGLVLCLLRFPRRELLLDLGLGGLLAGWFFLVHTVGVLHPLRLPKEIAVGLFFAAAVFIPALAHQPRMAGAMILPVSVFCMLCTVNGLLIHTWESNEAVLRGKQQEAPALITSLARHAQPIAVLCCGAASALLIESARTTLAPFYAASAVSGALFLLLHRLRSHVSKTDLRALADLVLLSPLFVAALLG